METGWVKRTFFSSISVCKLKLLSEGSSTMVEQVLY